MTTCGQRRGLPAIIAVSVAALLGCGGSGSSSEDTDTAGSVRPIATSPIVTVPDTVVTAPPTTELQTTVPATTMPEPAPQDTLEPATTVAVTNTVDPRPVDPEDQALALAGVLQAESYPTPWTAYSEGGSSPVSTESCSYRPDGAVTFLTNGASQDGPTMQMGDTGAFASSAALAFPDETLAMEYIGVVNTDAWGTCRAGQLQEFQRQSGNEQVVSVVTRDSGSLNQDGFESYAEFNVTDPDGAVTRVVLVSFYRLGRTVIIATVEYGGLSDADFEKLFDDSYNALVHAYDRVNGLGEL